jgi:hypothetical protein
VNHIISGPTLNLQKIRQGQTRGHSSISYRDLFAKYLDEKVCQYLMEMLQYLLVTQSIKLYSTSVLISQELFYHLAPKEKRPLLLFVTQSVEVGGNA